MITIVHISDFHFSAAKQKDQTIVVEALLRDLKHLSASEGVHPSIIVFSGDLVQAGDDPGAFDQAAALLLTPVLEAAQLGQERLFIVPGNHDVQRSAVTDLSEAAMRSFSSAKAVNKFLDDLLHSPGDYGLLTKRLDNFRAFVTRRPGAMIPTYADFLSRCYSFVLGGSTTVAVACLNTAWRATGATNNTDYGILLLGERQIDAAITEVANADVRVAVFHHPFEWWAEFERVALLRRLTTSFDLVLSGHTHYADPYLRWDTSGSALMSSAGCLYQSREYFNGYSIIEFDEHRKAVTLRLREYYDAKRQYDRCLRLAPNGQAAYSLVPIAPRAAVPTPVQILDAFRKLIDATAEQALLSALHSTSAPRTLAEIFVTPTLGREPETGPIIGRPNPDNTVSINDIINSTANVLIVGRRETGRTTLLLYVATRFLDQEPERARLPFYINMRELSGKPKHALRRAMQNFALDATVRIDIDDALNQSRCVLCLDDFDPRNADHTEATARLLQAHPGIRVICAAAQEGDEIVAMDASAAYLGFAYEQVYIFSFGRRQIRHLVERWHQARRADIDEVVDRVASTLMRIGVPRNPTLVSILLLIFERQQDFVAANRAALIEMFVQVLLEKIGPGTVPTATLDFRNREHYLEYVAGHMVERDQFTFDRLALEKDTLAYFEAKGLHTYITRFIDYFVDKEVFAETHAGVSFRFRVIAEYFIAKRMIEDPEFMSRILAHERPVTFFSEFDIVTGLQRNNKQIVELMAQRVEETFHAAELTVDPGYMDRLRDLATADSEHEGNNDYSEPESSAARAASELVQRRDGSASSLLESLQDHAAGKDATLDDLYDQMPASNQSIGSRRSIDIPKPLEAILYFGMYARAVRNCELIDDVVFKMHHVSRVVEYCARLVATAVQAIVRAW